MEEIIRKIIAIENSAQGALEKAQKERENTEMELKANLEKLEDRLIADAYDKVEQLRTRELKEAEEDAENLAEKCKQKVDAIDAYHEELADMWCDQLVKKVLKR